MGTDTAEIEQLENARAEAMLNGDDGYLATILDNRLVYTHSNASSDTKESYLQKINSGRLVYRTLRVEEREIRMWPGAALVNGRLCANVLSDDVPRTLDVRFAAIWISASEEWKMISFTPTPIAAA